MNIDETQLSILYNAHEHSIRLLNDTCSSLQSQLTVQLETVKIQTQCIETLESRIIKLENIVIENLEAKE